MTRYYKIIDGEKVFYPGYIIANGIVWTKPTVAQIEADGWQSEEYEPPVPEPVPKSEPDESDTLNAVKAMLLSQAEALTDEDALEVAEIFPTWQSKVDKGQAVSVNERLWDNGHLWRVVQAHTPQSDWRPEDTTPTLFVEVAVNQIPEWRQPTGAQDAYMTGDKVTHQGQTWESSVDNNVWEPGVYGWVVVNQ